MLTLYTTPVIYVFFDRLASGFQRIAGAKVPEQTPGPLARGLRKPAPES
jgi:hypothetical protein